jgi:hypothetical protein
VTAKVIAILVDALGFVLATFFLVYGVKAGFVERQILADFHGHYETGRAAIARGVLYVAIGSLFLAGAVVLALSLSK